MAILAHVGVADAITTGLWSNHLSKLAVITTLLVSLVTLLLCLEQEFNATLSWRCSPRTYAHVFSDLVSSNRLERGLQSHIMSSHCLSHAAHSHVCSWIDLASMQS